MPPVTLPITIPSSLAVPHTEMAAFIRFLQQMTNRRAVGYVRYGKIDRRQRYMSRLETEVKAYRKSGNAEQLRNIAVYAFLEYFAPENTKFHDNALADSVTRKRFGGSREGD